MRALPVGFVIALAVLPQSQQPATPASSPATPPKPLDCSATAHRQFDFWLGEWDVVSNPATAPPAASTQTPGAPQKPGRNVITLIDSGCVLLESWTATGQTGHSFNIYDRTRQRWHQTWVDNSGGLHEYWGSLQDGNMVFTGEVPLGPASRLAGRRTIRVTFFPLGPDKLRQFSEALNMDGTWSVNYDLIYTRRQGSKPE
jgi:hypothetical protein